MTFQRLANAKLVIRTFQAADADEFVRAAHESIETIGKWMSWCSRSFTRDSALEWFASCDQVRAVGRAFDMGIFCATTGQLLGGAGINQLSPHHRYGNIGYWVRQSRQGCGIAAGATFECRARNRIFLHGQPLDAHIYALIPADFCGKENSIALSEVNGDR